MGGTRKCLWDYYCLNLRMITKGKLNLAGYIPRDWEIDGDVDVDVDIVVCKCGLGGGG